MSINHEEAEVIAAQYIDSLVSSGYCNPKELEFDVAHGKEYEEGWLFFFSPQGVIFGGYSEIFGVTKSGEIVKEKQEDHALKDRINEVYKLREENAAYRLKHGYF